ncbi:flagellar hook-basal body complex protein FliE [Candidatus Bandiella numerosa]|jgi:flagellar hook-basal body complex protein FliE|uniref:flagellar hook-basal body complex protein FliE n=1 Tax=Candidatus Bandiella numerosa TaxID=2570586 RepID=UPI00249DB94B|nr:flagellar hook-basal body complex protein FliE [Candidatus Bandiella numerosa]WHA04790.1 flagellar hook-basal body complex protein FliE [Candidatus Bandiella numerosa]
MTTSSSIKPDFSNAVEAYKKANKNVKNLGSSSENSKINTNSGHGVLYAGDKMDVLSQGVTKTSQFSSIVQELIKTRVQKVKNADKVSLDAIKGRTGMIEVMEAINNSEIALQEIVTVRDKIVAAYLDILKMPL